jgi:hypothetical protein
MASPPGSIYRIARARFGSSQRRQWGGCSGSLWMRYRSLVLIAV